MQHDAHVTLCIDTRKPPNYKAVILKGRASMEKKLAHDLLERMSVAHMGQRAGLEYAAQFRNQAMVVVRFKPERVISWDYAKRLALATVY